MCMQLYVRGKEMPYGPIFCITLQDNNSIPNFMNANCVHFYVSVTVIDSPPTHFLISCLHSYLFTFLRSSHPPTHFLIFRPCHFHPFPAFLSRSVSFLHYVAHISCLAVFCNHLSLMRTPGLGSKRLIWLLHLSSCDRLELFREHE